MCRFYKANTTNYHILKQDGYFLGKIAGSDTSPYEGMRSDLKFSTVTDLIDFYTFSSDKSKNMPAY